MVVVVGVLKIQRSGSERQASPFEEHLLLSGSLVTSSDEKQKAKEVIVILSCSFIESLCTKKA